MRKRRLTVDALPRLYIKSRRRSKTNSHCSSLRALLTTQDCLPKKARKWNDKLVLMFGNVNHTQHLAARLTYSHAGLIVQRQQPGFSGTSHPRPTSSNLQASHPSVRPSLGSCRTSLNFVNCSKVYSEKKKKIKLKKEPYSQFSHSLLPTNIIPALWILGKQQQDNQPAVLGNVC